jgi:hypothetical protein
MNLQEIKQAVISGKKVYWKSELYEVVKDNLDQWFIKCTANNNVAYLAKSNSIMSRDHKGKDFFTIDQMKERLTEEDKHDIILAKNIIARELKRLYKESGEKCGDQILSCFDDLEKSTGTGNQPTGREILESKNDL